MNKKINIIKIIILIAIILIAIIGIIVFIKHKDINKEDNISSNSEESSPSELSIIQKEIEKQEEKIKELNDDLNKMQEEEGSLVNEDENLAVLTMPGPLDEWRKEQIKEKGSVTLEDEQAYRESINAKIQELKGKENTIGGTINKKQNEIYKEQEKLDALYRQYEQKEKYLKSQRHHNRRSSR